MAPLVLPKLGPDGSGIQTPLTLIYCDRCPQIPLSLSPSFNVWSRMGQSNSSSGYSSYRDGDIGNTVSDQSSRKIRANKDLEGGKHPLRYAMNDPS